ncbi:MAG TPA: hypothetical protein VKX41_08330 [Alloacidobacterium sp.]|jgi:hypothetical protein|nr:hypothetical protein [Alloacidobacterium sp.]
MQIERVGKMARATGKCMPGAGAPSRRDCRVASGALVAPAPGTSGIENVSVADTRLICAGYDADQFSIRC